MSNQAAAARQRHGETGGHGADFRRELGQIDAEAIAAAVRRLLA